MHHWLFSVDHTNSTRNPFTVPQSDLVCVIRLKGILESSWPQSSKTWHQPSKKKMFHSKFRLAAKTRDCFENWESKSPSPFRGWGVHLLRVQSVDLGHKTGWKLFVYPLCIKTHLMWKMWLTDLMCGFLNQESGLFIWTFQINIQKNMPHIFTLQLPAVSPNTMIVKSSFLPAKMVKGPIN